MQKLSFFVGYVLPVALLAGWSMGPWAWWLVPAVGFAVFPLLDYAVGEDQQVPIEGAPRSWLTDLPVLLWLPMQLACLAPILLGAGTLTGLQFVGWAVACGIITGGGGITVAHELVHRKSPSERALAELLMLCVSYPWFCVEHVLGHHRNVATPLDPATSRLGESVYTFWFRSVFGGVRSAWRLETQRVANHNVKGLGDRRLRYAVELIAVIAVVGALTGGWGLAFFGLQSVLGFSLLEVINYVEHYGLQRDELPSGRFERVQPRHSWNSNHAVTNRLLFQLPRHADHHAWAFRTFDQLRPWPDAPTLPFGYPTMVLIALVPPLWRTMMDPRVARQRTKSAAA